MLFDRATIGNLKPKNQILKTLVGMSMHSSVAMEAKNDMFKPITLKI